MKLAEYKLKSVSIMMPSGTYYTYDHDVPWDTPFDARLFLCGSSNPRSKHAGLRTFFDLPQKARTIWVSVYDLPGKQLCKVTAERTPSLSVTIDDDMEVTIGRKARYLLKLWTDNGKRPVYVGVEYQ